MSAIWPVLACAPLLAQQPNKPAQPPAKADDGAVFVSNTRLVVLHATVLDKNGHLVTNLPKTAFQVYENEALQSIKDFKREDVPVSMGLIVDNSGSMRDKREKVKDAALALVKDSNTQDEVFVVNFNDEAFLDTKDFTSNIKDMEEALSKIDSRGGTAMRDAIRMSIDEAKEKGKRDKKVLVMVTDGNDNSSLISLENLVRASQQSGILIYTIGLLSEEEHREAEPRQTCFDRDLRPRPAASRTFPRTWPTSARLRIRWRTTSAISTSLPTRRACRRSTARSARSG